MKKLKKVIAFTLMMVMMMAMSVTAFAAEGKATVKVDNASEADVFYQQIIEEDTSARTGWNFVKPDYAKAFGNEDAQTIIDKLTGKNGQTALDEITRSDKLAAIEATTKAEKGEFSVSKAGLYVVKLQTKDGVEKKYNYTTMAFYVSRNDIETGQVINREAKKEPKKVDKELTSPNDKVVEIGKTISYTVKVTVPYVPAGKPVAEGGLRFAVHDSLTGAVYNVDDKGNLVLSVKLGKDNYNLSADKVTLADDKKSFTVDLSELVKESNLDANKEVTLVYTVTAKDVKINNEAYPEENGHKYNKEDEVKRVDSYTGDLKITKTGDGKNLAGAEFVILKGTEVNDNTEYAVLNDKNELTGWTKKLEDASHVVTLDDGSAVAHGFDNETTYSFKEVVAPTGYQVKQTISTATWKAGLADNAQLATAVMDDDALVPLPFTGGMGTTIFTVLGVAIMALAAALYFVSKRTAKN
ncbi:LPXTG-motif cell wall anchor domain-containing protein/fimbrial isopeptide formation D2 domain-containing protein [Pseudobutyrivibrio sp. OR37]|uniref:isopeptide-forming domain-containing fimbrial protein n=1 Tax=Pseudobutyrivibrio sp. OR37 TaxID=1798186 RepID=UPI0008E21345|nr:isopeptide-forming domain-containing fimbrial protein [Pseudobutyrivibrio sp. OR37]SFH97968.1 LPXTG-motif cell wall anchor domain-containing protein/fimbrial isopeptide formation D2 domain-containing protein [Pseudobutyrivibrio sp. OR37]